MKVPSLRSKELIRIFNRGGFIIDHQTGSHCCLRHKDGRRIVIPRHNKELKRGTLLGIIKQAGYNTEEFMELL